ncbi:MAG: KamA family radical SAM protein [bacterium]
MSAENGYWDRLTPEERRAVDQVEPFHPFKITSEYSSLIDWSDPEDPLRRQVVPSLLEMQRASYESADPLEERIFMKCPGLIHKYIGRALWTITQECPIHCRFCFRKWEKGVSNELSPKTVLQNLESVVRYLKGTPDISEIILSGGDPLCLDRRLLDSVLERLNAVRTLRHIRLHTRAPVVAWENEQVMKPPFIGSSVVTRIVLHINHPHEIQPKLNEYVRLMQSLNVPVLSQSVLLAGINDDENTLYRLFSDLAAIRIQPYYLHQIDAAWGTSHFRVSDDKARLLVDKIRVRLPGYAVPKLVKDIPGSAAKTLL